jgi:hypothetical protein
MPARPVFLNKKGVVLIANVIGWGVRVGFWRERHVLYLTTFKFIEISLFVFQ